MGLPISRPTAEPAQTTPNLPTGGLGKRAPPRCKRAPLVEKGLKYRCKGRVTPEMGRKRGPRTEMNLKVTTKKSIGCGTVATKKSSEN